MATVIAGSTATITIDAADTEELEASRLYWDLEIVDGGGLVHTVATGVLNILPTVTNPAAMS